LVGLTTGWEDGTEREIGEGDGDGDEGGCGEGRCTGVAFGSITAAFGFSRGGGDILGATTIASNIFPRKCVGPYNRGSIVVIGARVGPMTGSPAFRFFFLGSDFALSADADDGAGRG